MDKIEFYMDNKIGEKFEVIETKLRNSFQAMKVDNIEIKEKIKDIEKFLEDSDAAKLMKDFDNFKAEVLMDLNDLKKSLTKSIDDLDEKAMRPLEAKMVELTKKISKQDLKNTIKKELYGDFDARLDKKYVKFSDKVSSIKGDIASYKRRVEENAKQAEEMADNIKNALREEMDNHAKSLSKSVSNYSSSSKRELSNTKINLARNLQSETKLREEEIAKLENQIRYLKGRITSLSNQETKVEDVKKEDVKKETKEKFKAKKLQKVEGKGFLTKIVDSLSD